MKKLYYSIFFIIFALKFSAALEWPVNPIDFYMLFGQTDIEKQAFLPGIIFQNAESVIAAERSVHLITIGKKHNYRNFPSTLGNAVIFTHDDGLQTVYSNIEDQPEFKNHKEIETASVIGRTGNSAWGPDGALTFQIIDTKNNVFINPFPLLPSINDKIPPAIENTLLVSDEQKLPLKTVKTVKHGTYELYSSVKDGITSAAQAFSPFRISIFLNGTNVSTIPFEVLTSGKKNLYLQGITIPADVLYNAEKGIYLGKVFLTRGKVELTINARDTAGNETSEKYIFQVE